MIRDLALQAGPAEAAVGQVQMDLLAEPPFGADAVAAADSEHPDHELRIDPDSLEQAGILVQN